MFLVRSFDLRFIVYNRQREAELLEALEAVILRCQELEKAAT